jgi:hypothetical protein
MGKTRCAGTTGALDFWVGGGSGKWADCHLWRSRTRCAGPGRDESGDLGDTWMWDGKVWKQLNTEGPSPRLNAAMAFDGQNILLFGGRYETPDGFLDLNDTWILKEYSRKRVQ